MEESDAVVEWYVKPLMAAATYGWSVGEKQYH